MPPQPPRQPTRSATGSSSMSRISTVSDFTDLGGFDGRSASPPLQPRPSLVSLHTPSVDAHAYAVAGAGNDGYTYASPTTTGWSAFTTYSPHGIGYSPVSLTGDVPPPAPPPKQQGWRHAHRHHAPIPEEDGMDLGLVRSAAPIDGNEFEHSATTRAPSMPVFDFTNTLGPTTKADEAFVKALQDQEAQGRLTGGLGVGIKTDMTVTESALLAASPVSERPLSRTFSRAGKRASRSETVKRLGQSEANKRGEVIEVVLEDEDTLPDAADDKVDISLVAGHSPDDDHGPAPFVMKQTTFPTRQPTTAVFYPQPNWKPFSMTWPYLLALIVLSLGLGAGVEAMYRASARTPLVTFRSPAELPTIEYFAIKFLPMIVAVSYGVLWQITNFEVMRLEPFYQLSKEGGALASESINVDYLTQFNLFRPFRALHYRHYAVAVSSVASLLANTLVPTLGAASIVLAPDRDTRLQFPDAEKHILVHPVWARLLTTTLVVVAALGCVLFHQLRTRRSGLTDDVKGIAGLASMATVSHILMDFKDMDVATHQDIHRKLRHRRYVLRNSSLAPASSPIPTTTTAIPRDEEPDSARNHLSANPHPFMLRPLGVLPLLTLLLAALLLLPLILFTPASAVAERAPWLLTALAVLIKLSWTALETSIRLMEPYYILSRRHAPPATLWLDYLGVPFGWVVVKGVRRGDWVVVAGGVGTVVAEVLTVLVTSLATVEGRVFVAALNGGGKHGHGDAHDDDDDDGGINAGQETVPSFWVSLALAMVILVYLGTVAGWVFVRRGRVFLPRQPNTIASVLAYIHQSKMLYGFVGTAKVGSGEMVERLEGMVKTYGLGWFRGRDGQSHCGVDEEELLSGYKVGYDYSRATKPWEEAEVNWL
ncbi:hypothetical protein C8A05DRAFT_47671 [Staphylotrichum tortipilum]|uniref:Spray n=1 Tax=Staphylotrichum tortipilum TaxID=2831512 RepID=A0AAN6MBT2_9PEZI|nr:hypothetical protein C8A05DRAFT_47671 [Staphylotrichum longicolle]